MRCGELLKQFEAKRRNQHSEDTVAADGKLSQREAAERAGMSPNQQVQVVRLAYVPEEQFTAQVESAAQQTRAAATGAKLTLPTVLLPLC